MRFGLVLAAALNIAASAATADIVPEGLEPSCEPCVFTTPTGELVKFDFSITDEGYLDAVAFDGTWYPLDSFETPDPLGIPPLVRVEFDSTVRQDIYSVMKESGARNSTRYYFLYDRDGMHLLGDAPELRFDAERDVFEGGCGFTAGAEISTYVIRDRKLVLVKTEQVLIENE